MMLLLFVGRGETRTGSENFVELDDAVNRIFIRWLSGQ